MFKTQFHTDGKMPKGIGFLLANIAKTDPVLLLLAVLCVFTAVAAAVINAYLPALAVSAVEKGTAAAWYLLGGAAMGCLAVACLQAMGEKGRGMRQLYVGRSLLYRVFLHRLDARFAYTESDEGQKAYEKARQVCLWGTDVRQVLEGLMDLIVCVASFLLFSGILGALNPWLVLFLLALSGVNYITLRYARHANEKRMGEQAAEMRRYFYLINAFQSPKIGKDIRLYRMGGWLCGVMDKCLSKLRDIHGAFEGRLAANRIIAACTALLRDGIVYVYLIRKVCKGEITVAEFVLYFGVVNQFAGFIGACISSYGTLRLGGMGMAAVRDYLEQAAVVDGSAPDGIAKNAPVIELKNVCFSYGDGKNVLDHVNLTIHAGEKLALVGLNGAGKTTLIKLLCGLYAPTSGQILIDGEPAENLTFEERRGRMAVLFQESAILPYTVAENISLMPLRSTQLPLAEDCLKQVGLYDVIAQHPGKLLAQMTKAVDGAGIILSGGQQQKLLMARMLYRQQAGLWILDEPTAALDPIAESETYEQFNSLCGDRTCIYISHRLASTRFLDRIILIEDGRIAEAGPHGALLAAGGKYAQLFNMQSKYYREVSHNEEPQA